MEYRVEVRVKNNQILKKIELAGYKTVGEFCRLNNKETWQSRIGDYVNLKRTPLNAEGDFFPHVYEMATLLNCSPEDLFTETQMQTAVESNKRTIEVNEAEMQFALASMKEPLLLEDQLAKDRMREKIEELLQLLTFRERIVIRLRFGIGGEAHTYDDLADVFQITRERARQIEAKALRKLRHPSRHTCIKDYIDEE